MNRIVKEHYPVEKLPEDLREGLEAGSTAVVTVEPEKLDERAYSADVFVAEMTEVRRGLKQGVTSEGAVARVRTLRDEWED